MRYKLFGRSALRVSELCLGTMTFGEESGYGADEAESKKMYDCYRDAGGNFIDTANIYTQGTSERMLGQFIAGHRDQLVLATKYTNNTQGDDPNAGGNHKKNMVQGLEASLKRLNTDYVDLFWVHFWDATTQIEEVMRGLDDLVRSGKVLHIAVSNAPAWVVSEANAIARLRGWTQFTAMQLHYNLIERNIEPDFINLAAAHDMAITPWSPLGGGLLTGKFNRDADERAKEGARLETVRWSPITDRQIDIAEKTTAIARELGRSPAQVALNWLRQNADATVIPIIGARTVNQLKDNLSCLEFELSPEHMASLSEASTPHPRYPSSLAANPHVKQMIHGGIVESIDGV